MADFIPKSDAKFNEWQLKFVSYAYQRHTSWGIPDDTWAEVSNAQSDFNHRYSMANDPETRTGTTVLLKNTARKGYIRTLRKLVKSHIMYNEAVNEDDLKNMDLPLHDKKPTPVPVPDTYPEFEVDSSVIRCLTVHFHDQGKKSNAKPFGVHGAEIKWALLPAPPVEVDELINSSFDTHSPCTLEFTESQRGKTVYFCLRWENTRGEKGHWSEIESAKVP